MPYTALSGTSVIFRFSKIQNDNNFYYLRNLCYMNNTAAGKLGVFDGESTLKKPSLYYDEKKYSDRYWKSGDSSYICEVNN